MMALAAAAAAAAATAGAIGPGRLALVVGPSGAGKDTLIAAARAICAGDGSIVFPRRIVTRVASAAEDNLQLSPAEFERAQASGAFALRWHAHGLDYALPRALDDDIRAGRTVVANVSRTVIAEARSNYADVLVILITAPPEVLASRIAARARSSDGSVAARVGRSVDALADVTIVNVGDPAVHAGALLQAVRSGRGD